MRAGRTGVERTDIARRNSCDVHGRPESLRPKIRNNWNMSTDMHADQWVDATEGAAREAWNRVKPASGIALALSFFACWVVLWLIVLLIPPLRQRMSSSAVSPTLLLVLAAVTFGVARILTYARVFWHRRHMPAGLVGARTVQFKTQGYEIVGGDDYDSSSGDNDPYWVARSAKAILFCPTAEDRRIDVLAYPAGSKVGNRKHPQRITLLISGTRVRLDDEYARSAAVFGETAAKKGESSGSSGLTYPCPEYKRNGEYLLIPPEAKPQRRDF